LNESRTTPLSVVVPVREGLGEVRGLLESMLPGASAIGAEVVVVGALAAGEKPLAEQVRLLPVPSGDMLELHRRGIEAARGDVVAIGEDHAVPRPDWWQAVVAAHAAHPQAPAVAGCLANATDSTLVGRANFLAFAAPWQPPMPSLPLHRPPPSSALTFKRWALEPAAANPGGWLEAELTPSLFAAGEIVADARIVVDHYQDHGVLWSIRNAFHSARSSYGYERARLTVEQRRTVARWALANIPGRLREEAEEGSAGRRLPWPEAALVTAIASAHGLGGAVGALRGKGRSPERVA
jgi:hypothetical protein